MTNLMVRRKKVTKISQIENFGLNYINFIINKTYYYNLFWIWSYPKKFGSEGFMARYLYKNKGKIGGLSEI